MFALAVGEPVFASVEVWDANCFFLAFCFLFDIGV